MYTFKSFDGHYDISRCRQGGVLFFPSPVSATDRIAKGIGFMQSSELLIAQLMAHLHVLHVAGIVADM